jgi:hypothetical protein
LEKLANQVLKDAQTIQTKETGTLSSGLLFLFSPSPQPLTNHFVSFVEISHRVAWEPGEVERRELINPRTQSSSQTDDAWVNSPFISASLSFFFSLPQHIVTMGGCCGKGRKR